MISLQDNTKLKPSIIKGAFGIGALGGVTTGGYFAIKELAIPKKA